MTRKLPFTCDYMEGAHPLIMQRLAETNLERTPGYGLDDYSDAAKEKIRLACGAPDAEIYFLVGGTQTNATIIDGILRSYEGVIAASTGHINVHEAGAIEFGGHKVLALPHADGKLRASDVAAYLKEFNEDGNLDHMVHPGMVYISQPTEYGTLYSLSELSELAHVCREYGIPLYADGARLAYALSCPENDVSLKDMARLCDAFYIGGTKCGALFGEAAIIPKPGLIPHLFTIIKQHGALLAKGRLLGLQFDTFFTNNLYEKIGASAVKYADRIREALKKNGYASYIDSPTNQVFCIAGSEQMSYLSEYVDYSFFEKYDDDHSVIRFVTSWSTEERDVDALCEVLSRRGK